MKRNFAVIYIREQNTYNFAKERCNRTIRNNMSKTIYYLGAGASYGKRDESGGILEGIPVVSEIPARFDLFRDSISKAVVSPGEINFWDLFRTNAHDVEQSRQRMLEDIDSLIAGIQEHATIDTYARKLYLTQNQRDFEKLKDVLCIFFLWEQAGHGPDDRYDTFLANVLEMPHLNLPHDISILSWNYDSQIEQAYRSYGKAQGLIVYEKNTVGQWPELTDYGRIIKLNGRASLVDSPIIHVILNDKRLPLALQLIIIYDHIHIDTREIGFQFTNHLSFAWEEANFKDKWLSTIKATIEDTEQVVVIGYSFPFFNREMDRLVFRNMPKLEKVYVQDINTAAVRQAMQAVLPTNMSVSTIPISDCGQFYLPAEL